MGMGGTMSGNPSIVFQVESQIDRIRSLRLASLLMGQPLDTEDTVRPIPVPSPHIDPSSSSTYTSPENQPPTNKERE